MPNTYHEIVQIDTLPADFNQWGLADSTGWTVAHAAARYEHLPEDFNQWGLADSTGWTVAHVAVTHDHLPVSFSQWGLVDNEGFPVLGQLLLVTQADEYLSRWEKERPLCKTDADWEVFKEELPEIYQKYAINGYMPDADNDREALQGALL